MRIKEKWKCSIKTNGEEKDRDVLESGNENYFRREWGSIDDIVLLLALKGWWTSWPPMGILEKNVGKQCMSCTHKNTWNILLE
jgi:hypothetical protein